MWINLSMTQSLQGPGKIQEEELKLCTFCLELPQLADSLCSGMKEFYDAFSTPLLWDLGKHFSVAISMCIVFSFKINVCEADDLVSHLAQQDVSPSKPLLELKIMLPSDRQSDFGGLELRVQTSLKMNTFHALIADVTSLEVA